MDSQQKCERLARKLRNILESGISLSDDVVHFIDSTFSNPSLNELQAILDDDSNCEKDSLIELLFFPDEAMQLELEDLLERLQLDHSDEDRILASFCRSPFWVNFSLPEDRGTFSLPLSPDITPGLLKRLRVGKHLVPELRAAIDRHADEAKRIGYKVKIRNARFEQHDHKIRFLCDLFQRVKPESRDFEDCLDFSLSLLDEMLDDSDMYEALMAKKRFYIRSLQRARKLETQLQKSNLETLLSQGKKVILVDKADARKKLLIIDRISHAIYGKTEYYEDPDPDGNRIEVSPDQEIQEIVKKLLP
jgi:hypothetical protein